MYANSLQNILWMGIYNWERKGNFNSLLNMLDRVVLLLVINNLGYRHVWLIPTHQVPFYQNPILITLNHWSFQKKKNT